MKHFSFFFIKLKILIVCWNGIDFLNVNRSVNSSVVFPKHVRFCTEMTMRASLRCVIHAALTLNSKQHNFMYACQVSKCLTFLSWLLDSAYSSGHRNSWTSKKVCAANRDYIILATKPIIWIIVRISRIL